MKVDGIRVDPGVDCVAPSPEMRETSLVITYRFHTHAANLAVVCICGEYPQSPALADVSPTVTGNVKVSANVTSGPEQ